MIRQNFKKIFEFIDYKIIPTVIVLFFEMFILDNKIYSATRSLNSYRCDRSSTEFNYTLLRNGDTVEVLDKYRMIDSLNIQDIVTDNRNAVKFLINRALRENDFLNIKCQKNLLMFYTRDLLADEVYILKKEPTKFKDFLEMEMIDKYEPIDTNTLKMFIYLIMNGYLEDHAVYVYRRMFLILNRDWSIDHFIIDLSAFFKVKISIERNEYLGHIKSFFGIIGYCTNS